VANIVMLNYCCLVVTVELRFPIAKFCCVCAYTCRY